MSFMRVFLAQCVYIFALGFQQLNVVGQHYAAAGFTSLVLGIVGYQLTAAVAIHAKERGSLTWWGFILGAPVGIVLSMLAHPLVTIWWNKWEN